MLALFQFNETSPAAAGTAVSSVAVNGSDSTTAGICSGRLDEMLGLSLIGELVGATGGVLDVYVQAEFLGQWYDVAHFPQLSAGGAAITTVFTLGAKAAADAVIGKATSPVLAAGTCAGLWGDQLRLVMVAGTSTSVGAAVKVTVVGQLPSTTRS